MIENDTIRLLRECDAGIQMGVASLDQVLESVDSKKLKEILQRNKVEHEKLKEQLQRLLDQYHDDGKAPNPIAKGMSWFKTSVKLAADETDHTVADLVTDGCNMGVKSLRQYLNQYQAADEQSKEITKKLIELEEGLTVDLRQYL